MEQPLTLPGTVFAIGDEAAKAAALYARLTGRAHRIVEDLNAEKLSRHDVVTCTTYHLTSEFMHRLCSAGNPGAAPGLICAQSPEKLDEVCRRQALRIQRTHSNLLKRIFLYPQLDFDIVKRGPDIIGGGAQTDQQLLDLLSADADILTIFAHSNGLDLALSRRFACPFLDARFPGAELSAPCQELGICTRFPGNPTFDHVRETGKIIPLKMLRARICIIFSCSVVKLQNGLVDPIYGLAAALLEQGNCDTLITTWQTELFASDAQLNSLVNDLSEGMQAGAAVSKFNISRVAQQLGMSLCLVGDPCISIEWLRGWPQLPTVTEKSTVPPAALPALQCASNPLTAEVALLLSCIKKVIKTNRHFSTAKGEALLKALIPFSESLHVRNGNSSAMEEIDAALVEFLSAHPHLFKFFSPFGEIREMNTNGICRSCSGPAREFLLAFPAHKAKQRQVVLCACCEDSRVLPAGWHISLDLSEIERGFVSISGVPEEASRMVSFVTVWGVPTQIYPWRQTGDRWLPFRIPESLPLLPFGCHIIIAHGVEMASVAFNLRKLPNGKYVTASSVIGRRLPLPMASATT